MTGRTRLVVVCKTEEERVLALKEHFENVLTKEEIDRIKGRNMELINGWRRDRYFELRVA
jgi:hypothetical protein